MSADNVHKAKLAITDAQVIVAKAGGLVAAAKEPAFHLLMVVAQTQAMVAIADALTDARTNREMKQDGTSRGYI